MSKGAAFIGQRAAANLLALDRGSSDAGTPIRVRGETAAVAVAGAGGEAIFPTLYLTLTHSMVATLRVTPLLDGVPLPVILLSVYAAPRRVSTVHELSLMQSFEGLLTYAPRGTWIAVRIEVDPLTEGDLIVDSVEVEYEIVQESK